MNSYRLASDVANCLAYVSLTQLTTNEILDWVYTILFCISIVFSIVMKVIDSLRDKKITSQEAKEIKEEVDEAIKKIDEHNKMEDK